MRGNSNSGNGETGYNGISGGGQGPSSRNPYLGDERLNGGFHWWYLV